MKKIFSIITLCFVFTFIISCENNLEELDDQILESYKQTIYLDENPIEVDFSRASKNKPKADEKSYKIINDFLKSNPNATFFTSPEDNKLHIFKSEEEFNSYLSKINIQLLKSENQISSMREVIDDGGNDGGNDNGGGNDDETGGGNNGGNNGGNSNGTFFASLRVYEDTNYINQLDQIQMSFWYQSISRPFSFLNTNNMNDKISSFILELGTATGPNNNVGAMATFYQHDFSGYNFKKHVNVNQRTYFYSNLHNEHMTTSWGFWNDTFNDEISSYKLEHYIQN